MLAMAKMTGSRFLAETFKGYGVTHVFFVPAIAKTGLWEMKKLGIQPVLTHGEKAAAYMADGYARASHKPGICMAQSVGAANLAAGLQDAYLGLAPVIAITGTRSSFDKYRHAYQEVEHAPLFQAVTKFDATVSTVEELPALMHQAFRQATSGAPAPVHLDFMGTNGFVVMNGEADLEVMVDERFSHYPALRPEPEPERVKEAAGMLLKAKRPVIVAGGGVTSSGAQKEVVELAEMLSVPVATSLNAKGAIADEHPLSVGVVGSYSRWCANRVVAEADLVLFVGSHTGSQVTNEWRIPRPGTSVIQIDINPADLGRTYPARVAILGDAKVTLRQLIDNMGTRKEATEWSKRVQQTVDLWRKEVEPLAGSNEAPTRPERLCKELADFLPSDAILVSDTGHAGIWTGTMVDLNKPGQGYIRAAGSLGWGLPAALGVKCAQPERPVILFVGDGGLWYHLAELETARRYGINIVVVVNNNQSLNQVQGGYADKPGSGELWQFSDVDLVNLARAFGCFGAKVTHPGEIKKALSEALASNTTAVVDVITDKNVMAPPPWA